MRTVVAQRLVVAAVAALSACSSSSSSSGAGSPVPGPGGGGGGTCAAFGAAAGTGTGAAADPCASCVLSTCRAEYNAAFGAVVGVPGGACKAYWDCVCACPSGGTFCQAECATTKIVQACEAAQEAVGTCVDTKCAACQ
jgi:hypothetical protein